MALGAVAAALRRLASSSSLVAVQKFSSGTLPATSEALASSEGPQFAVGFSDNTALSLAVSECVRGALPAPCWPMFASLLLPLLRIRLPLIFPSAAIPPCCCRRCVEQVQRALRGRQPDLLQLLVSAGSYSRYMPLAPAVGTACWLLLPPHK